MSEQPIFSLQSNHKDFPKNFVNTMKNYEKDNILSETQENVEYQRFDDGKRDIEFPGQGNFSSGIILILVSSFFFAFIRMIIGFKMINDGEVLATYSIIKIFLMSSIAILKGYSFFPDGICDRISVLLMLAFGGLSLFTAKESIRFLPTRDAIAIIYSKPVFTMMLATIFSKYKLSPTKFVACLLLLTGTVLITRSTIDTIDKSGIVLNVTTLDFSSNKSKVTLLHINQGEGYDNLEYFIGCMIAFVCSISASAYNLVCSKLGDKISVTVQLVYLGVASIIVSGLWFIEDGNNRLFSAKIIQINVHEWVILLVISCMGIVGSYMSFQAFLMICPTFISSLRAFELIIALIFHGIISFYLPSIEEFWAAILIILGITCLLLESQICDTLKTFVFYRSLKSATSHNNTTKK